MTTNTAKVLKLVGFIAMIVIMIAFAALFAWQTTDNGSNKLLLASAQTDLSEARADLKASQERVEDINKQLTDTTTELEAIFTELGVDSSADNTDALAKIASLKNLIEELQSQLKAHLAYIDELNAWIGGMLNCTIRDLIDWYAKHPEPDAHYFEHDGEYYSIADCPDICEDCGAHTCDCACAECANKCPGHEVEEPVEGSETPMTVAALLGLSK